MSEELAKAITDAFETNDDFHRTNEPEANFVDGLLFLGRAVEKLARATERLGLNDAVAVPGVGNAMGGLESLSHSIKYLADVLEEKNGL